jgi:hypothetical protein
MPTSQSGNRDALYDGRDELNLADFPISVLQRQQPTDDHGAKLDTAVYEATRYDRDARQRVQQRVTLETSSKHGLPTPADENVVLALLYVAKHTHGFADPVVPFAPRQLFRIMGWAPNSRSYDRLRQVLRRLKALVIRYENSWWDIGGRAYEAEVATGIVSEYRLARQVGGRKQPGAAPACWVCWTPRFQQSLSSGNLKKLDLERLFALKLPTSQRLYRFLDKRFYPPHQPPVVEMDVYDLACGHVGLTRVANVAELKRRLAPAIAELEETGFIAKADPAERYQKVRPGVWRVRFRAGPDFLARTRPVPVAAQPVAPVVTITPTADPDASSAERDLARDFYGRWGRSEEVRPGGKDLVQARNLIEQYGADAARDLIPDLVQVVRRRWPDCKSFSGAVEKYLAEALAVREHRLAAQRRRGEDDARREMDRQAAAREARRRKQLEARWAALPEAERAAAEQAILAERPELRTHPGILRTLCLNRLDADEGQSSSALPLFS